MKLNNLTSQSNSSTNTESTNGGPDELTVRIIDMIFYFDALLRIYSTLVHLAYFVLIYKIEQMRRVTLLYAHHVTVVGFLFNLHYIFYFNYTRPTFFAEQRLNELVCAASETLWAMLKNLRTYSIALIAAYRYMAVFRQAAFRALNGSRWLLLLPLLLVYLLCACIYLASKFAFATTYGPLYCFDGYSSNLLNSLLYFLVNCLLGISVPTIGSVIIYALIQKRLNRNKIALQTSNKEISKSINTRKAKTDNDCASDIAASTYSESLKNEKSFAKQFFLMDLCEIISSLMVIGLGMRYLIPNLNNYYNIARQMLRSINLLVQSMIPVISIYFNPYASSKVKKLFKRKNKVNTVH
jgi:hypothetical protein